MNTRTWAGSQPPEPLRAAAASRFGSDKPGAFAEVVAARCLGWLGARRGPKDALISGKPMAAELSAPLSPGDSHP